MAEQGGSALAEQQAWEELYLHKAHSLQSCWLKGVWLVAGLITPLKWCTLSFPSALGTMLWASLLFQAWTVILLVALAILFSCNPHLSIHVCYRCLPHAGFWKDLPCTFVCLWHTQIGPATIWATGDRECKRIFPLFQ